MTLNWHFRAWLNQQLSCLALLNLALSTDAQWTDDFLLVVLMLDSHQWGYCCIPINGYIAVFSAEIKSHFQP